VDLGARIYSAAHLTGEFVPSLAGDGGSTEGETQDSAGRRVVDDAVAAGACEWCGRAGTVIQIGIKSEHYEFCDPVLCDACSRTFGLLKPGSDVPRAESPEFLTYLERERREAKHEVWTVLSNNYRRRGSPAPSWQASAGPHRSPC